MIFKWGWIWAWKSKNKKIAICDRPLTRKEQAFVVKHLEIAKMLAAKYTSFGGAEFDDLYQEAVSGLMRASKTYDPKKTQPSTYAFFWIRSRILKYLKGLEIVYTQQNIFDIRQVLRSENRRRVQLRMSEMDNDESVKFISIRYKLDTKKASKLFVSIRSVPRKIPEKLPGGEDSYYRSREKETELFGFCDPDTSFIDRQQVTEALSVLSPRSRGIVQRKFGICNETGECETLQVIADSLDPPVSRERVRQIIVLACEKMRPMVTR